MSLTLKQFITNVDELVRKEARPAITAALVGSQMGDLLRRGEWFPTKYTWLLPGDQITRYLMHLAEDESWSMEAFVWRYRAMTPVHDHGVWGVVGQYVGSELDTRYEILRGNVQEDRIDLRENGRIHTKPGDILLLVPPDDIHQVRGTFQGTSVSVHVYGGNMKRTDRHEFDLSTGKVTVDRRR